MSRYSGKNSISDKMKDDAMKIARSTQRPGQTKEQTRLIAQGIQKGIEQYKKQQSAKTRELDKKLKKAAAQQYAGSAEPDDYAEPAAAANCKLAWSLLLLSWLGFAVLVVLVAIR